MKLTDYKSKATHRVLIYGPPKSGKTSAVAKLAEHYNILHIDIEDGAKVYLNPELKISDEAKKHVEIVSLPDTKDYPIAFETVDKIFKFKDVSICEKHGKISCPLCTKDGAPFTAIEWSKMDDTWIVVIDSNTQLSNSVMNGILKRNNRAALDDKAQFEDYGQQGKWLDALYSIIQNCDFNVIVISHEMGIEQEDGKEKLTAVAGTKNFSRTFPRYFDHVIYCEVKAKKHTLGSSTGYTLNALTGSRTGAKTEASTANPDNPLLDIFTEVRKWKKVSTA